MTTPPNNTQATFEYSAFSFKQQENSPRLVLFIAKVSEIQTWASVKELSPKSWGSQREGKEARVEAISDFLRENNKNSIPTAIIVAFEKDTVKVSSQTIEITQPKTVNAIDVDNNTAATIVDGQHRLMGMNSFDPNMYTTVIGLLDSDFVEQAFQFLVINNKSSKVPAPHLKALLAKMKDTDLPQRLKGARIAFNAKGITDVDLVNSIPDSPFYEKVDWTLTEHSERWVQATAIEQALYYIGSLGIPEFDDLDTRRRVFLKIWSVIKDTWPSLWVKDSKLIAKVNILCLTRLIIDRITNWADSEDVQIELTNLDHIKIQTQKILKYMNPAFWNTPWPEKARGGFDTAQGKERYLGALIQLYRNGRKDVAWYSDIEIIDITLAKDTN